MSLQAHWCCAKPAQKLSFSHPSRRSRTACPLPQSTQARGPEFMVPDRWDLKQPTSEFECRCLCTRPRFRVFQPFFFCHTRESKHKNYANLVEQEKRVLTHHTNWNEHWKIIFLQEIANFKGAKGLRLCKKCCFVVRMIMFFLRLIWLGHFMCSFGLIIIVFWMNVVTRRTKLWQTIKNNKGKKNDKHVVCDNVRNITATFSSQSDFHVITCLYAQTFESFFFPSEQRKNRTSYALRTEPRLQLLDFDGSHDWSSWAFKMYYAVFWKRKSCVQSGPIRWLANKVPLSLQFDAAWANFLVFCFQAKSGFLWRSAAFGPRHLMCERGCDTHANLGSEALESVPVHCIANLQCGTNLSLEPRRSFLKMTEPSVLEHNKNKQCRHAPRRQLNPHIQERKCYLPASKQRRTAPVSTGKVLSTFEKLSAARIFFKHSHFPPTFSAKRVFLVALHADSL